MEKSRVPGLLLRLLITLALFALVFRSVDLNGVLRTIREMEPAMLLPALAFQLASIAVAAYRWRLVMTSLDFDMDGPFYFRSYFKGMFFNQALPTSIGGDAVRVLDVARQGFRKRDALPGVMIDRGLGLMTLLLLNLIANSMFPDTLPDGLFWTINLLVFGGLVGFAGLTQFGRLRGMLKARVLAPVFVLSDGLRRVQHGPVVVLQHLVIGLLVHLFAMLAIYFIGTGVGIEQGLGTFLIIVPPVILLTIVPISLAGWGVREGAMVGLFTLVGSDQSAVLSMSILYGLLLIVASLPGLYVYLRGRRMVAARSVSSSNPPA